MNTLFGNIVLLIALIVVPYLVGYLSGRWKRDHTEAHNYKWVFWLGYLIVAYFPLTWPVLLTMTIMIKPLHDLGYTYGYGRGLKIEVGFTSWDDRVIRWIFRLGTSNLNSKLTKVAWTYYSIIFIGCCVLFEFLIRRIFMV